MPTNNENFAKPPIVEAVLDIRVKAKTPVSVEQLAVLKTKVASEYPKVKEKAPFKAEMKLEKKANEKVPTVSMATSGGQISGYQFISGDGRSIFQAELSRFTFNRLKPYSGWDNFFNEGMKNWGRYLEVVGPLKIARISLRYVNRIDLPLPMKDLRDFILTSPDVPPNLPQTLAGFFLQLKIPFNEKEAVAILNQTVEPPAEDKLPYIFDTDVIHNCDLASDKTDDFLKVVKNLRDVKNNIFHESLTEKTKELFR